MEDWRLGDNIDKLYLCKERDGIFIPLKEIILYDIKKIYVTPKTILNTIITITGICEEVLKSKRRDTELVIARNVYILLSVITNNISYSKIAILINRDHSTIIHSLRTLRNDKDMNPKRWKAICTMMDETIKLLQLDHENIWNSINRVLSRYN